MKLTIKQNISDIHQSLPAGVQLVCVSKYHTEQEILEAYLAGERDFGESRAQELERKAKALPTDIRWHFIGHLQRNKAKQVCRYAYLIQSVDSERLLRCIDQTTEESLKVLLEVHVAAEDSKTGLSEDQLFALLEAVRKEPLYKVSICGLMGMATQTDNEQQIAAEFATLRKLFDKVKAGFFAQDNRFATLSMGMSDDYHIAIAHGTNMVRIGSRIFAHDE